MSILFLNHSVKQCGVYQYGTRFYEILKTTPKYTYIYCEVSNIIEYYNAINTHTHTHTNIQAILYNYHSSTMPWLKAKTIQKTIKNIAIIHESPTHIFDITFSLNPESPAEYYLPRPIYENVPDILHNNPISTQSIRDFIMTPALNTCSENSAAQNPELLIPIFGSFGFGFEFKGFDKIVELINLNYDAAIIKFVIPTAFFDPHAQTRYNTLYKQCMEKNIKPGIKVYITNEFFTNTDLLHFLASNTVNIFLYDMLRGRSISSATDYALSVKKPLLISDSCMFRHIYSDDICPYKTPIQTCINNSLSIVNKYCSDDYFSNINLINKVNNIMSQIITDNKNPDNTTHGQAHQDLYVLTMLKNKTDGKFLEIGSNHPITTNNTYLLETKYNWSGIMVEYDSRFGPMYETHRPKSKYIINDARHINYINALESISAPYNMDYLQIDLDVDNKSTLDTLELLNNTVFDKYTFATVTFETDIYRGDFFNTRQRARDIFISRGYKLIFPDVCVYWEGGYKPFEDWWAHPDLVDIDIIHKYQINKSLNCDDIKKLLLLPST